MSLNSIALAPLGAVAGNGGIAGGQEVDAFASPGVMAMAVTVAGTAGGAGLGLASATMLATLSSAQAMLVMQPGEWSVTDAPAVTTAASITRPAEGDARHICRSISACNAGSTAQPSMLLVLRDGAAGVGPILWSMVLSGANQSHPIFLGGISIVGSVNTDMTLEFTTAPAAGNNVSVAMTGLTVL